MQFADWKAINAQALVDRGGECFKKKADRSVPGVGCIFGPGTGQWPAVRRHHRGLACMAHKVADQVYSRITGEGAYFDSRVAFVSESGPKDQRLKRLAIMDYDGANVQYLTDSATIVLAPRFRPLATGCFTPAMRLASPALSAGRGPRETQGTANNGRHDELFTALLTGWPLDRLFADAGREHGSLEDGSGLEPKHATDQHASD